MKARYLVLLLVIFGVGFALGQVVNREPVKTSRMVEAPKTIPAVQLVSQPLEAGPLPGGLTTEETRNIEIFRQATNSVVSVRSMAFRYNLFSLDVMQIPRGSGSGFVWNDQGHIVTNFHVIDGGTAFVVTLADQSEWEARVVGQAPDKDLAVLHIEAPAESLNPLSLGRSAELVVGQSVLALGNPFGLDHSLTLGVLSAVGRELESPGGRTIRDVLQTDAAINPGNSGGPLLDSGGRLIGVNTAIISPSRGSAGVSFAIPVDTVRRLVPQLIEYGKPIQPGIGIRPVPDGRLPRGIEGVGVWEVTRGGPAEKAGLEGVRVGRSRRRYILGDIIVAVDGQPIHSRDELLDRFEDRGVGARVTLTVQRDGRKRDVQMRLVKL